MHRFPFKIALTVCIVHLWTEIRDSKEIWKSEIEQLKYLTRKKSKTDVHKKFHHSCFRLTEYKITFKFHQQRYI